MNNVLTKTLKAKNTLFFKPHSTRKGQRSKKVYTHTQHELNGWKAGKKAIDINRTSGNFCAKAEHAIAFEYNKARYRQHLVKFYSVLIFIRNVFSPKEIANSPTIF